MPEASINHHMAAQEALSIEHFQLRAQAAKTRGENEKAKEYEACAAMCKGQIDKAKGPFHA